MAEVYYVPVQLQLLAPRLGTTVRSEEDAAHQTRFKTLAQPLPVEEAVKALAQHYHEQDPPDGLVLLVTAVLTCSRVGIINADSEVVWLDARPRALSVPEKWIPPDLADTLRDTPRHRRAREAVFGNLGIADSEDADARQEGAATNEPDPPATGPPNRTRAGHESDGPEA